MKSKSLLISGRINGRNTFSFSRHSISALAEFLWLAVCPSFVTKTPVCHSLVTKTGTVVRRTERPWLLFQSDQLQIICRCSTKPIDARPHLKPVTDGRISLAQHPLLSKSIQPSKLVSFSSVKHVVPAWNTAPHTACAHRLTVSGGTRKDSA